MLLEYGRVTQKFHSDHAGYDIGAPSGTPVIAIGDGQKVSGQWEGACGNTVTMLYTDGKLRSRNCHLSAMAGVNGRFYPAGTAIGRIGSTGRSTGPHLHIETYLNVNGRFQLRNPNNFMSL